MPLAAATLGPFHLPVGAEWAALLVSYLVGSIPFGWVLARALKGVDLRRVGSGNIGATNAMRVLGKPLGVLAFALDFGKGWLPVALFAEAFLRDPDGLGSLQVLCGAAAVVGHVFPLYLGFRGGKAVATGSGAIVAIDPLIFLIGGLVWMLSITTVRMVSVASILMALTFPVVAWQRAGEDLYGTEVVWGTGALAALVVWRHRANLLRIASGTEPRTASRGTRPAAEDREA